MSTVKHAYETQQEVSNRNLVANFSLQKSQQGAWERFKSKFQWESLTVAGKEVKGFVITPAIATTITGVTLAAFLSAIGWAYSSNTKDARETHDAVIRMETMLNERTRTFERDQDKAAKELKDERTLAQLQRENQDKKQQQMIIALKAKGINIE